MLRMSKLPAVLAGMLVAALCVALAPSAHASPTAAAAKSAAAAPAIKVVPADVGVVNGAHIFEIEVYPVAGTHKCIDASTSDSLAGQPGDPVTVYSCFNNYNSNPNQWWHPIDTDVPAAGLVQLANWEWPGLCLDMTNGDSADLTFCSNVISQDFDWASFSASVGSSGSGAYGRLIDDDGFPGPGTLCLEAVNSGSLNPGLNGDPLDLYLCTSAHKNQLFTYLSEGGPPSARV